MTAPRKTKRKGEADRERLGLVKRELAEAKENYVELQQNDGSALVAIWAALIKGMNVDGVLVTQAKYDFRHVLSTAEKLAAEANSLRASLASARHSSTPDGERGEA